MVGIYYFSGVNVLFLNHDIEDWNQFYVFLYKYKKLEMFT